MEDLGNVFLFPLNFLFLLVLTVKYNQIFGEKDLSSKKKVEVLMGLAISSTEILSSNKK